MQFPLNCTGKIVWAKIPYFGGASQFRTGGRAGPVLQLSPHPQAMKSRTCSGWRSLDKQAGQIGENGVRTVHYPFGFSNCFCFIEFRSVRILTLIGFLDIATSIDVLCVIEDEDNWLSGGNLTHERIPAGFLGSLESCTSFRCLTSLDYAHCAPCREKLDAVLAWRWKIGMIGIALRFNQTANVKSFSGQC